ncbi:MAG: hypothetical protein H0V07_08655 [Propionibacteriales bacterium]|nr:hypothetical protein [Propionibacteriales bacterium]
MDVTFFTPHDLGEVTRQESHLIAVRSGRLVTVPSSDTHDAYDAAYSGGRTQEK